MAGGYSWSRRVMARVRTLRALVNDTQHALHDIGVNILTIEPEIHSIVREIGHQSSRATALVVLGSNSRARARLLHCLLGRQLLPEDMPRGCRWIRIQHGSSTQVHLSLGNSEFELVEELECNQRPWDVLPAKDLIRKDVTELTTIVEVEINNQFLKDGLCIIIPPDIGTEPGASNHLQLKSIHSEFYAKRTSILRNFNCVYLYGVDKTGNNVFSDNVCANINMSMSRDENIWDTYNLYTAGSRTNCEDGADGDVAENGDERVVWSVGEDGEPAVFSPENCLDLHQIKDINPNSQLLFFLFSDAAVPCTRDVTDAAWYACSDEMPEADRGMRNINRCCRQTAVSPDPKQTCDSAKQIMIQEQVSFMNELIEQWELMSRRPRKHYVKSQWGILDDAELMRTVDLKHAPAYTTHAHAAGETFAKGRQYDKLIRSRNVLLSAVVKFGTEAMQSYLLEYCSRLSEVHIKLLQRLILASFSLARELQVVPRRVHYVARRERQLFQTINEKFSQAEKKQELLNIMQEVIQEMKADINNMDWSVDQLPCHQDRRFAISNSYYCSTQSSAYASLPLSSLPPAPWEEGSPYEPPSDGEDATLYDSYNLEEYDIIGGCEESYNECSNDTPGGDGSSPSTDILVENETEMFSLSTARWSLRDVTCSSSGVSYKHATADVQQTVLTRLSWKISLKLVKFLGCLKESYFGTLQRCVESLEATCRGAPGGRAASEATRQLLAAGRRVRLRPAAGASLAGSLLGGLRRLLHGLRIVRDEDEDVCCALSPVWRRRVATHFTQSLSPHRLARIVSTQIIERLTEAHERYQSALAALEAALAARLHHTEDVKLAIRKVHAPAFAKLCLESTSMCDLLMYGTPELGREIGRGQYGVVYSVRGGWAGRAPVAAKSVLPADERHYRELAMEFFYTRSIPAHPRVVPLLGSVVTRAGGARCVLLLAGRWRRDLHAAVRAGLPRAARLRAAADVVEGIRYLHSLGLVHRDIKLKNVLLDPSDRAALSDLGFCAAGGLMSGSVVGTPVHMAPELGAGPYAASVDVYAFGILFWYLCSGDVRLPAAFEVFNNKQQLWNKVKKGCRPERLPHFTDECWNLMESCWHADPDQRALLGDVHLQLQKIIQQSDASDNTPYVQRDTDEDSLDFTGGRDWDA